MGLPLYCASSGAFHLAPANGRLKQAGVVSMNGELESILIVLAIIAIALLVGFWMSKRRKRSKTIQPRRIAGPSVPLPFAMAAPVTGGMSAAEMVSRLQPLRDRNAQWDQILPALNPTADPEVERLLIDIRGPNLFAPHVGLNVIEEACKRVLSVSPHADVVDALRQAIHGQEPFVR